MAVRTAPAVSPSEVLDNKKLALQPRTTNLKVEPDLAVIDSEIEMVESVMSWSVYDRLERVSSDHVRVMDLPRKNKEFEHGNQRTNGRTKILQKLTKTNKPRYSIRCKGKTKMNMW